MRYSFVVPIYRDGALAGAFCREFHKVFAARLGRDRIEDQVELIFVDDGSPNDSAAQVAAVLPEWPFAKQVVLSRNFGQHVALSCGYEHARGAYVGMLNVDMEDAPDQIPKVLDAIEAGGFDIVTGVRPERKGPWFNKVTSLLFNWTLNKLTGARVPLNAATLRVMNRPFVDAYNSLEERSRYLPGLEVWIGFRHGYVPIQHQERRTGRSSYNFRRRLKMAWESILSFSDLPLRMAVSAGLVIAVTGFLLTANLVIAKLRGGDYQHGYTSTVAIMVFLGGVQILVIGVAALYVGRILREVQRRPLYIVRERRNIAPPESRP